MVDKSWGQLPEPAVFLWSAEARFLYLFLSVSFMLSLFSVSFVHSLFSLSLPCFFFFSPSISRFLSFSTSLMSHTLSSLSPLNDRRWYKKLTKWEIMETKMDQSDDVRTSGPRTVTDGKLLWSLRDPFGGRGRGRKRLQCPIFFIGDLSPVIHLSSSFSFVSSFFFSPTIFYFVCSFSLFFFSSQSFPLCIQFWMEKWYPSTSTTM